MIAHADTYVAEPVDSIQNWPAAPLMDGICLFCGIASRRRHSWFCTDFCEAGYASDESCQLNLCEMVL